MMHIEFKDDNYLHLLGARDRQEEPFVRLDVYYYQGPGICGEVLCSQILITISIDNYIYRYTAK